MAYAKNIMGGGTSAGQAAAITGGGVTGIVALGTTNVDATPLQPVSAHEVTTSAASTGVRLADGAPGDDTAVFNNSGQTLLVYPPAGDQINALAVTTQGFSMANGKTALFRCISSTRWMAILTA
jgi:hypothetical protein